MVRPTEQDRESVAITHVRISPATKALLDRLKTEGGYRTHNVALINLLTRKQQDLQPQPQQLDRQRQSSTTITITRDMLQRPDVNKLISSASKEIYHKYVSPRQRTVRLPVSGNRVKRFTD